MNSIPLKFSKQDEEDCLFEFQGQLVCPGTGKFTFSYDKNSLIMGNRIVYGRRIPLDKPLVKIVKNGNTLSISNVYKYKIVFDSYPKLIKNQV